MAIVGFSFEKIEVEKKSQIQGKVNIKNNVSIKNVEETDLSLGTKSEKALKYNFEFISDYSPNMGSILLKGIVLSIEDEKQRTNVLADWKKNKSLKGENITRVMNHIFSKCNVEALLLSKEVNLPPPIQLPRIKMK